MRKTFTLHVGHFKTGTTAVQVFAEDNRKALLRRGIDYPDTLCDHSKHSRLALALYRAAGVTTLMHGYKDPTAPEQVWGRMFDHAAASPAGHILVSSEEFMRMGAHPEAVEVLRRVIAPVRAAFDFRVIAYLRAPGPHLRSWYNQLVKMKAAPPDFNTAVHRTMERVHYDYAAAVAPWVDIFGRDAVTLRPYRVAMRQGDAMYRDFLATLGVDYDRAPLKGWRRPETDLNPRLDERLLEVSRAMQEAGMPEGVQPWVQQRAGQILQQTSDKTGDFTGIAALAEAGLAALEGLPGNGIARAEFAAKLPEADPAWKADLARMTTVLLREQVVLRQRMMERQAELLARIEALETRLDSKT